MKVSLTREPREAMQFGSKREAQAMARAIGWRPSDAIQIEVFGFSLWAIANDHMSYVKGVASES